MIAGAGQNADSARRVAAPEPVAADTEHIAEWIRLTEEKQSAQLAPKGPIGHRPQGGLSAAVRELGITRQEGQRAVKIAAITPEAEVAASKAGLSDNQSALLAIPAGASMPPKPSAAPARAPPPVPAGTSLPARVHAA